MFRIQWTAFVYKFECCLYFRLATNFVKLQREYQAKLLLDTGARMNCCDWPASKNLFNFPIEEKNFKIQRIQSKRTALQWKKPSTSAVMTMMMLAAQQGVGNFGIPFSIYFAVRFQRRK